MKLLTLLTLAATLSLPAEEATATPAAATTPPFGELKLLTTAQVRVDVLMVSVTEGEAIKLLPILRDSATVEAGQKTILDLVAQKKAVINAWPEVTAHDGENSLTENVVEKPYYDGPDDLGTTDIAVPIPEASETAPPVAPPTIAIKNIGANIELGASISQDGKSATLQLAPQRVAFIGMERITFVKPEKGTFEVKRPIFATQKVTSTITLRDGERRLILTDKAAAMDGYIDFFIVGVKIVPPIK